jgi:hypothetical protein
MAVIQLVLCKTRAWCAARSLSRRVGHDGGQEAHRQSRSCQRAAAVRPLLQPLRELNGRISIDETGIDFQNLKGLLVGLPAGLTGRWRFAQKPQLLFDFTAPNLDVGYFYSQLNPEAADFYANLQGVGKLALGQGRIRAFRFSDLRADVTIDRRVWRLENIVARSAGGSVQGSATFTDLPGILGVSVEPKVQGVPVQGVLDWFDAGKAEMSGKVDLTGKLEWRGRDPWSASAASRAPSICASKMEPSGGCACGANSQFPGFVALVYLAGAGSRQTGYPFSRRHRRLQGRQGSMQRRIWSSTATICA